MDPTPGSTINPTHGRIGDALAVALDGDIIKVKGLTNPLSGFPMAYSDNPVGGFPAEMFPMTIKAGVTLQPYDASPVYVWSTAAQPPASLITLDTANVGQTPTRIGQITFAGASTLLTFHRTGGSVVDVVQVHD